MHHLVCEMKVSDKLATETADLWPKLKVTLKLNNGPFCTRAIHTAEKQNVLFYRASS